ncbi:MAG: hypothetical protein IIC73_05745 [Armatimonadetes bacterium]|nr:hypothetical protein [Armatimonadota bacterium]
MIAFAADTLVISAREKRIEQALKAIVLEYDFQDLTTHDRPDWETVYIVPLKREEHGADVLQQIEEICSGWDIEIYEPNPDWPDDAPWYVFRAPGNGRRIAEVHFQSNGRSPSEVAGGTEPYMHLEIHRTPEKEGVLEWLRDLWPW